MRQESEVAYWDGNQFWLTAWECGVPEKELAEIDERQIVRDERIEITNKGSGDYKEYLAASLFSKV